jgi:hypothetical protein
MNKYIIYKHTIQGKSYIGFTSLSMQQRLKKHITNALSGIDSKFYRFIRKYKPENIKSEILYECSTREEALKFEKKYIKKYNTFKTGLNLTEGGTGGDIVSKLPPERYKNYINKCRSKSRGTNNARYSGVTDLEIVDEAVKYYLSNKGLIFVQWFTHCKKIKYPITYSKFRFEGNGRKGFLKCLKNKLDSLNIHWKQSDFEYDKRDLNRRKNISSAILGRHWYNDGYNNYMIYSNDNRIIEMNLNKGLIKHVKNKKN